MEHRWHGGRAPLPGARVSAHVAHFSNNLSIRTNFKPLNCLPPLPQVWNTNGVEGVHRFLTRALARIRCLLLGTRIPDLSAANAAGLDTMVRRAYTES